MPPIDSKPREERDFRDFYPDLDETQQLRVFVVEDSDLRSPPKETEPVLELKRPSFAKVPPSDRPPVKFGKLIAAHGYADPSRAGTRPAESYIRPFSLEEGDSVDESIRRKQRQAQYDMDEQDYVYLEHRNSQPKNRLKVLPEVFEILISVLEREWHKLELQMSNSGDNAPVLDARAVLHDGHNAARYGSDDGVVAGSVAEQKCAVCNDSECDNANAIVFCDGCNIAVHQECYGIAFIPEGQWLCRKCMLSKNRPVTCSFCPSGTGAFKQLDSSQWSHVICGLWINELYFANPVYMEPIEGIDAIPKSRWRLLCYVCRQKGGACIQCLNRSCFRAYHVTCAKRAGLYMAMGRGVAGALALKASLKLFCDRHGPSHWDSKEVLRGIQRTRHYFGDVKLLRQQNDVARHRQRLLNKLNVLKWRTDAGTPIAPRRFSDILVATAVQLKVTDAPAASAPAAVRALASTAGLSRDELLQATRRLCDDICRYWALKRAHKKAALIRAGDHVMLALLVVYGNNDATEVQEKLDFAGMVARDVERLTMLGAATVDRQKHAAELARLLVATVDAAYFPLKLVLEKLLDTLCGRCDGSGALRAYRIRTQGTYGSALVAEMMRRMHAYEYASAADFDTDVTGLISQVVAETKPALGVGRAARRWQREYARAAPGVFAADSHFRAHPILEAPGLEVAGACMSYSAPAALEPPEAMPDRDHRQSAGADGQSPAPIPEVVISPTDSDTGLSDVEDPEVVMTARDRRQFARFLGTRAW